MDKFKKVFAQVVVILLIGALSIWITSFFSDWFNNDKTKEEIVKEVIKEVIIKRPVCQNTTESFVELKKVGQTVTLASNFKSYGIDGAFAYSKTVIVKTGGSGSQVACGYLFMKAHTGSGSLQLKWEHPYVRPGDFGGHLITDNAISTNVIDNKTELLFDLSQINYYEKLDIPEHRKADWVALLNVTDRIECNLALSTTDKKGNLDEISIIYKCWNPETGKETTDCRLSIE